MLNIIFPKKAPQVAGYQFDAVLEDTFEASINLARYPVESGVMINDHRIINPMRYYITGVIGSKPLKPLISPQIQLSDLQSMAIGAASNLLKSNPLVSMAAGLTAGFLAGSNKSRGSSALDFFIGLMRLGMPFTVDAVDIQLKNMVITSISRTKTPDNEQGVELVIEIQELITLNRLIEVNSKKPNTSQLPSADPIKSACAKVKEAGEQIGKNVTGTVLAAVQSAIKVPSLSDIAKKIIK